MLPRVPTGKKVVLPRDKLLQVFEFFHRVTGTLEPLRREVLLLRSGGPALAATDGTLFAELRAPWLELDPGRTPLSLPLDPIRDFLRQAEEQVEVLLGSVLRFASGRDVLVLEPRRAKPLPRWPQGERAGEVPPRRLSALLDFVSSHLTDGDWIEVGFRGGFLCAASEVPGILAASRLPLPRPDWPGILVPYGSARHLVKALEFLKAEAALLECLEDGLLIAAGGVRMALLGHRSEGRGGDLPSLFSDPGGPVWVLDSRGLKAVLRRAARVERSGSLGTSLSFFPNRLEVEVRTPQGRFTSREPVLLAKSPRAVRLEARAEAVLRLVSRASGDRVRWALTHRGMLISDGARAALLGPVLQM